MDSLRAEPDDIELLRAIEKLVIAAHEVNRWALEEKALHALCDAAIRYVAERDRFVQENGIPATTPSE